MAVNDLITELGKPSITLDEDMEKRVNLCTIIEQQKPHYLRLFLHSSN
jgi:hypothetical protein